MKTDDIVYFDDAKGVVICVYPSSTRPGSRDVDVLWLETGVRTTVWESDLLTEAEYLEWDQ